ncbi:MAG: YaiO family outer membrane beta-barrel protein [Gemmatimonadales bacterium]
MKRERLMRLGSVMLLMLAPAKAPAQQGAGAALGNLRYRAGTSWVEAGGFYHHVTDDFGSWKGGYARAVIAGSRDVWYLEVKGQEAFNDTGLYGSLSNVHVFADRFYTQVGVGGGTGDYVLPDLRADASLNFKLGRSRALVVTAGGTWVESKDVFRDRAVFGSLTWYATSTFLVEAGGRFNWTDPNTVESARGFGSVTVGRAGSTLVLLRGSAGTEGYQLTGSPETLQKFRSQEASLSWRQWVTRQVGTVLGGEWYHNPSYTRAGALVGLFYAW